MTAVLMYARADLRRRWRAWVGLAVLVAVVAGPVVALAGGARRTDSAYSRFLVAQRAADVELYLPGSGASPAVTQLPEVTEQAAVAVIPTDDVALLAAAVVDPAYGTRINRFKMVAGRRLDRTRADEAVVSFVLAQSRHLRVGGAVTIPLSVAGGPGRPSRIVQLPLRVVGIEASAGEFPPQTTNDRAGTVYVGPMTVHNPDVAEAMATGGVGSLVAVRLRHGHEDVARFQADLVRVSDNQYVGNRVLADQSAEVQRSIHLQAVALWLMASFAAGAGALVLLQLLVRLFAADAADHQVLRSLGATPAQLVASGVTRALAIAATGAVAGVVVGALASPLFPLGTARIAEPAPGFAPDAVILAVGAAATFIVVVLLGAGAVVRGAAIARSAGTPVVARRASWIGQAVTTVRLPLAVATGVRLALQPGRGRGAVPVRTTLVAAALGVAAITAAFTFGASLSHLLDTPRLYGTTYDAHVTTNASFGDISPAAPDLEADPDVAAVTIGATGVPLRSGSVTFGAQYTEAVKGALPTTVVAGRIPVGPDEIVIGSHTLHDLHAHVGQTIGVAVEGITGPRPMHIVGSAVLSPVSENEQLGQGAVITTSALQTFVGLAPRGFKAPPAGEAFIAFRPGVDHASAVARLERTVGAADGVSFTEPVQPTDIANFGQVRALPRILAGLLSVIALGAVAYLLLAATGRRRRDLAVLKTLGLVPRQIAAAIGWQATTVAVVALAVGAPLGVASGRSVWTLVAAQVGVVDQPVVPWSLVVALVPAALVLVNLVAAGPAMAAARIRPASVLRSE